MNICGWAVYGQWLEGACIDLSGCEEVERVGSTNWAAVIVALLGWSGGREGSGYKW